MKKGKEISSFKIETLFLNCKSIFLAKISDIYILLKINLLESLIFIKTLK